MVSFPRLGILCKEKSGNPATTGTDFMLFETTNLNIEIFHQTIAIRDVM
jgi:hypothetical protein